MINLNNKLLKFVLNIFVIVCVLVLFYYVFLTNNYSEDADGNKNVGLIKFIPTVSIPKRYRLLKQMQYNLWLIFTKVNVNSALRYKFINLITNLVNISTVPLNFNIIVDTMSESVARTELFSISNSTNKSITYVFYDVDKVSRLIEDIVDVMTPHFSSKPGTYYSDALFYLSLGLHRIAPVNQTKAIMLDCDLFFKDDVALLFREFNSFKPMTLFGLVPELSPVYRHVLHSYRLKHNTTFGDFYHKSKAATGVAVHPRGYQGYNSGVVMLNLSAIRKSKLYSLVTTKKFVDSIVNKYNFHGHLGDQDFYTLLGYEHPDVVHTLSCGFNRQLCTWWRDHGYKDVFDDYFKCRQKIVVLHGNCNSPIPK